MVRIGGGWDILDHFLLKHDPCRLHVLASICMFIRYIHVAYMIGRSVLWHFQAGVYYGWVLKFNKGLDFH